MLELLKESKSKKLVVTGLLFVVIVIASFMRFYDLRQAPPGLNQDEAINAWNAYCLLKTGKDQHGVSWPIFYLHALGGNSAPLHFYFMIPFQAIGGLTVLTTRLPAALVGVVTILMIYVTCKKLYNKEVGLIAAILLTFNPWHLYQSRWGHDAAYNGFAGLLPLTLLLLANVPTLKKDNEKVYRPILAMLAGLLTGLVCYGYHPIRIFVPVFLLILIIFTIPWWVETVKTKKGILVLFLYFGGFMSIYGPMVWQYIFHPEGIASHAYFLPSPIFDRRDLLLSLKRFALQYYKHFDFNYLFIEGDGSLVNNPCGIGQYHLYTFIFIAFGAIAMIYQWRTFASRALLALIAAYPVGDCIFGGNPNSLRCGPGMCSLIILAAVGAYSGWKWLEVKRYRFRMSLAAIVVILIMILNIQFVFNYYTKYFKSNLVNGCFVSDLVEACRWLKPRFEKAEAVFCTNMSMPYSITLVGLGYDPKQWFKDERDIKKNPGKEWEYYRQYGKMYFIYDDTYKSPLEEMLKKQNRGPIYFIIRPGEYGFKNPIHKIYIPSGEESLWICQI